MKKYSIVVLIIILIIAIFFIQKTFKSKVTTPLVPSAKVIYNLPESWDKIEDSKVQLKLEKKVDQGLKPQIVLIISESSDATNPTKYVDRLIAGARSAIPSLKIVTDKRYSEENKYFAIISGYYFNQKTKISINQRVYISGQKVSVLTASFNGTLDNEINQILDSIVKEKI